MKRPIVFLVVIGSAVLGLMLILPTLMSGSRQLVSGGCLINFGEGCNVVVYQTYSIPEGVITMPVVLAFSILVVLLIWGIVFWALRRIKGQ